ncbi:flagellin lysine-N-methylase [Roseburia hominis]
MLYTIPDYYKEFRCIAGACEDTCCAGWQIVVDEKSLKKYKKVEGPFARKLRRSVNWKEGTFRQEENRRCAFLNEKNLCDLYTALGKKSLCRTCRLYPRHVEEFENVREITLSLSCPEAARLILGKTEPVHFLSCEKEGEEEYEDFDPLLYSALVQTREVMLEILQDRTKATKAIQVRGALVLGIAHDLQFRMNRGMLFSYEEILEKYRKPSAALFVEERYENWKQDMGKCYDDAQTFFANLYDLEILRQEWKANLDESAYLLYGKGAVEYQKLQEHFQRWQKRHFPELDVMKEQILVYFIFTYLCGAVYDGNVYAKVKMAVLSTFLICELLAARWSKNGETLEFEDIVEVVYRFSREIEHSDLNLERMERCRLHL